MRRKTALDGNGLPWDNLLHEEELRVHAEDTLRTENLNFGDLYDKGIAPDLEVSAEAAAMMGVVWCEVGQHWVREVEDGVCDECWQQVQDEIA